MHKRRIFTLVIVSMIVCSLTLSGFGQVKGAIAGVTHYNVDFLQETPTVGLSLNLIVVAADSANATVGGASAVNLTCSDTKAILPTNPTLTMNSNGIASCSMYFGTPGTQTVTVTDTTDNSITGTLTVTVASIHFNVSVIPTTITVGESVNVTVTALDASDNVLTTIGNSGYGSSIDFSSTDNQAVFPLEGKPSCMVNGIGIFNITLNTVGTQTITATNKAFPLVNATTNTITVNAAATPTPSPTPEATPTPTLTTTNQPTVTPQTTSSPTAQTPTSQAATADYSVTIIILAVVVIAVVLSLVAAIFIRKKHAPNSTLPPPPPPQA